MLKLLDWIDESKLCRDLCVNSAISYKNISQLCERTMRILENEIDWYSLSANP